MRKFIDISQFHPSPEFLLMLSSLRLRWNLKNRQHFEFYSQKIDWEFFLYLLQHHRVFPLVYQSLKGMIGNTIPDYIQNKMRTSYKLNAKRILHLTAELVQILDNFKEHNIRAIPIKGPTLALRLYGNLHSRSMGDLDIVIAPEDICRVETILKKKKYQRLIPKGRLTHKKENLFIKHYNHFLYFNSNNKITVEIHWKLSAIPKILPLTFNNMWGKRETVQLAGREIPTLSKEQTFLHLCEHGTEHAFYRLLWLCDVAEFIHKNPCTDWEKLLEQADNLNIYRHMSQSIYVSNILFQTYLPEQVREVIQKNQSVQSITKKALFFIIQSRGLIYRPITKGYRLAKIYRSQLEINLKYKFFYWIGGIFYNSEDWDRISLPNWAFSLYFILRPIFWFQRWFLKKKNNLQTH